MANRARSPDASVSLTADKLVKTATEVFLNHHCKVYSLTVSDYRQPLLKDKRHTDN